MGFVLRFGSMALLGLLLAGCDADSDGAQGTVEPGTATSGSEDKVIERNPNRNAYFGDLHVHTRYSFDAYLMGTRRSPDDAYRFAKGEGIEHATGFVMKMKKPLDFQSVTDHAFYLGVMAEMSEGDGPLSKHELAPSFRDITEPVQSRKAFAAALQYFLGAAQKPDEPNPLDDKDVARDAWEEIIAAAERHNDPGNFTTFIGYEYTTGGPAFENLHRNVIFANSKAPKLPFSRLESENPEDLWTWMDGQREAGIEALAIPHNSNGSNGWMFQTTKFGGEPMDAAYAVQRMRNEPIVENTQVKGTSDTHPLLSPNDEWADFEIMPIRVASVLKSQAPGSYVRDAYSRGLVMEETKGFNPYKFGVIGSSDTHNAAGSFEEDNYWSKTGITDITPEQRGSVPLGDKPTEIVEDDPLAGAGNAVTDDGREYSNSAAQYWGASGLAGVWAESNTREDIYNGFRRKETFSTSGPHIKVRFFASDAFDASLLEANDPVALAYEKGVPMGGDLRSSDLSGAGTAPNFFLWAVRDPDSQTLQRLQIIKGWMEDGETKEQVFDVACSDGGTVDPVTHRCPDNGAEVNLKTCAATPGKGAAEMTTVWQDPAFDAGQRSYYYVRVLENPKCRWSTWDAIRSGVEVRPDMHATIQDRAWSSPIWFTP